MLDYQQDGDIAILQLNDGKANALGSAMIEAIHQSLDRAEQDAKVVVFTGIPGRFSAGFNLRELDPGFSGPGLPPLVENGGRLLLRIFSYPKPVIAACSGHAIAAGALMLLASDTRIGTDGDFKIGLNETAIGMALPVFGLELAKARLASHHQTAGALQSRIYNPQSAVEAGFLDQVVPTDALMDSALEVARTLAQLPESAYAANKLGMREYSIQRISESL